MKGVQYPSKEREKLLDTAGEVHSVQINVRLVFDMLPAAADDSKDDSTDSDDKTAFDSAVLLELERMANVTAVAVKYAWIAFEWWCARRSMQE